MTVHDVLMDLAAAQRALQRSGEAFDDAIEAQSAANRAQLSAIDAMRAANRAQLDVLHAVIAATEKALQLVATNGPH
jgi:hypothetical protein